MTDRTYAAVDKALGWTGGFTARVAAGHEPLPDWPATPDQPVDFRSGVVDELDLDRVERFERHAAVQDALQQAMTIGAILGRSIERLGLAEHDPRELDPPPDMVVDDAAGRRTVIEAKSLKPRGPDDTSAQLRDLVGLHTMWSRQGAERMILFTVVDWPWDTVTKLADYGIEYADTQQQLEELLGSDQSSA